MASADQAEPRKTAGKSPVADEGAGGSISARESEAVEDLSSPRTPVIYLIVRRLGEEEMARPAVSLWWSGFAAGLSISLSLLAQAILAWRLPNAPLLSELGYAAGFVVVIMSRQQLFTENTLTVVLPVLAEFTTENSWRLSRLWTIVFLANLAGALFAAAFFCFTPALDPDLRQHMLEIAGHILGHSWMAMAFKGIAAGFLMAAMVWLLPVAEAAQFHVIAMMTWLIAAGGFMHIVAGSVEAFLLILHGDAGALGMLLHFGLPVLIGNVIGGTALFALLAHGQVMKEI